MSHSSWPVDPLVKPVFRESLTAENDEPLWLFLNCLMVMECCKNWDVFCFFFKGSRLKTEQMSRGA